MIDCMICNEKYDEPFPDIARRTQWNICNKCLQNGIDILDKSIKKVRETRDDKK